MFLTNTYNGYNRHGEQCAAGWFLVLCEPQLYMDDTAPLEMQAAGYSLPKEPERMVEGCLLPNWVHAFVVYTRYTQCGQFMMGRARWHGHKLILSGAYGADGLFDRVPYAIWNQATQLPNELYLAWANGGGHNSAGNEAPAMRKWAVETLLRPHLDQLRKRQGRR